MTGIGRNSRLIVGCMTGTSIDGIDAALVEVSGEKLAMSVRFVRGSSRSLGALSEQLRAFAGGEPASAESISRMSRELGNIHVEVLKELLSDAVPDLIVLHGQTVFHKPPLSWQLIDPWQIAVNFPVEIIFDLRGADLAAGGEGAPITPLADLILFGMKDRPRVIVNLGGFINYTYLPSGNSIEGDDEIRMERWADAVRGGDVSPCNQLLDRITRRLLRRAFDEGGRIALGGNVDKMALNDLLDRLNRLDGEKRSLGSGDEAFGWIEQYAGQLTPGDILRTACAAIASKLVEKLSPFGDYELLVAGGGVWNKALIKEIESRVGNVVKTTDSCGIPVQYREAIEMAILGDLALSGVDITLSQITRKKGRLVHGSIIRSANVS